MDPLPKLSDTEFLRWWHFVVKPFTRDVDRVDLLAARQWESLQIATYVHGRHGSAAR